MIDIKNIITGDLNKLIEKYHGKPLQSAIDGYGLGLERIDKRIAIEFAEWVDNRATRNDKTGLWVHNLTTPNDPFTSEQLFDFFIKHRK